MKLISIMTACYNEEENIAEIYTAVKRVFETLPHYKYEHIFIDNASEDRTVKILKNIASQDKRVKLIVNAKNFGHIRSPYHGLIQARGDAVISIVADLQDPPSLIPEFLKQWEAGSKIVIGIKLTSDEHQFIFWMRKLFYRVTHQLSHQTKLIKNFTGFGLYDKTIIDLLRELQDPYPYFRGLIAELGYDICEIPYHQPKRQYGRTKNNFYSLLDMALLGLTNHSKLPLRIATLAGFVLSGLSLLISLGFVVLKLMFWDKFNLGVAPTLIGIFFLGSVQLFFIGLLGEYIGAIYIHILNRPRVIERERINF